MLAHFTDPSTAEFWVFITFLIFMGVLFYFRVPALIGKALDKRAEGIRTELEEARRLREEAQALLAEYQRKAREAEEEAKSIIEQAKQEAQSLAAETKRQLAEGLARRTKMAEEKIARAEAQAVNDVRASAVEAAVAATERLLTERVAGQVAKGLVDSSISDLKGKLN